jgi:hypothetical protein
MGNRRSLQSADTQPLTTVGSRHSYGTIGEHQSEQSSFPKSRSRETYRGGHPLFDVPEEVDEDYLENALEADGFYLGSCREPNPPLLLINRSLITSQVLTIASFKSTPLSLSFRSWFGSSPHLSRYSPYPHSHLQHHAHCASHHHSPKFSSLSPYLPSLTYSAHPCSCLLV